MLFLENMVSPAYNIQGNQKHFMELTFMKIIILSQSNADKVDLAGTQLTVYHRTKGQDIAGKICDVGFMVGGGAAYGRGIYTTYTLKSSLQNYNLTTYGGEVLKAEMDISGFLIFDYDIAKRVYGSNYRLTDQVKVIGEDKIVNSAMGRQKQWDLLTHYSKQLNNQEWTSDVAGVISGRLGLDRTGLNGIIYTGRSDGRVALSFKAIQVTPISHAWIDGKTYKNPQWESCGERTVDELRKLKNDEVASRAFYADRKLFLNALSRYDTKGVIDIMPQDFPAIPSPVFDELVVNFLYEDEDRVRRLGPRLKERFRDIIAVDFLIKKLKSAPTVYWSEWQDVDEETRKKIPMEMISEIWTEFLDKNKGHWDQIPENIRHVVPKDGESDYWTKLVRKNPANWQYVPKDITQYIQDQNLAQVPTDAQQQALTPKGISESVRETEEMDIPKNAVGWVQDEIAKMNKKAAKLGLPPITLEVIGDDRKNKTQKIKIVGNVPVLKGWKLIARINVALDESGQEVRMVEPLTDNPIPEDLQLDVIPLRCDHCGYNRRRLETYVVRNEEDGNYKMIGTTCLGDFIGDFGDKDPEAIAKYAEGFRQLLHRFREGNQFEGKTNNQIRGSFKKVGVPIQFYLSKVLMLEKQFGFVGKKQSTYSSPATSSLAWQMCIDDVTDQKYSQDGLSAADITTISNALEWIKTIPQPPAGKEKDFLWNLRQNVQTGTVFQRRKRADTNTGIVSWLPMAYRANVNEETDYEKLLAGKGNLIYFSGILKTRRPLFMSIVQQGKNQNITQDYCVVENDKGERVVWFQDIDPSININDPISVKGKVDDFANVENQSATSLREVEVIPEEDYEIHKGAMDQKVAEFRIKHQGQGQKGSQTSQKYYQDGQTVEDDFKITKVDLTTFRDNLFGLQDANGKYLSAFVPFVMGNMGDTVRLQGTVKIKGRYTNLTDVKVIPTNKPVNQPSQAQQPQVMGPYKDGDVIEEDFKVLRVTPAQWGNRYTLRDNYGRTVSAFPKTHVGNEGDTVRLKGMVKLKGQYVNLTRVQVIPQLAKAPLPPPAPPVPQTPPIPQNQPQAIDATSGLNWYQKLRVMAQMGVAVEDEVEDAVDDIPDQVQDRRKYKLPNEMDLDKTYNSFKSSYEKATGKSWSPGKFKSRASDWIFYGEEEGYIAVRPQRLGLYKLVGIGGDEQNPMAKGKALIKAFNDLMSENQPVWGMVSADIKIMAERLGMKSPPVMVIKQLMKFIPQGVWGGAVLNQINPDGGVELEYGDIGKATKYFVANSAYYLRLAEMVRNEKSVPLPVRFMMEKIIKRLANLVPRMEKTSSVFDIPNFISLEDTGF